MSAVMTETRYGPMIVNPNDKYMGKSLLAYGEYSPDEQRFYREFLKPGMVVIEAGGSFGVNTVPFATHVGPRGRVYTFEPQRRCYQMLCGNVALNNLNNVFAFNAALGSEPGIANIIQLDFEGENNTGGLSIHHQQEGAVTEPVPVLRIDDVIPDDMPVHLVQLDVEGMELEALKGGEQTIMRTRPMLYLESDRPGTLEPLVAWLKDHQYAVATHEPLMFIEDNWKANPENIWPENLVARNLICAPLELVAEVV